MVRPFLTYYLRKYGPDPEKFFLSLSRRGVFCKKRIHENFAKFTGKQLYRSLFFGL